MAHRGEDLYEQHAQGVYRYLFSLGADADTAEDLTQETFCQALKSLDTFRGDCSPQTWLCAIAKRLWYKELERRKRFAPLTEDAPAPDSPVRETEEREQRLALYRAMQRRHPGGHAPAALRRLLLPGDRGDPGPQRGLGPGALLPGQGRTHKTAGR